MERLKKLKQSAGGFGKGDSSSGGIAATLPCIIIMAVQSGSGYKKGNNQLEV